MEGDDIDGWRRWLEADRQRTASVRSKLELRLCMPCDLALLIASAIDYPRAALRWPVVDGVVLIASSLGELLECGLPIVNAHTLIGDAARIPTDHPHAILMRGAMPIAFRFRLLQ